MGKYDSLFDEPQAQQKSKYSDLFDEPIQINNPQIPAGHGMGDLRMAESPAGLPPEQHNESNSTITKAALAVPRFIGDVGTAVSTGPINAIAQGIQDKGFTPWNVTKNLIKSTTTPIANLIGKPYQNPVQSSETSLERAGVPNQSRDIMTGVPGFVMRSNARNGSAGLTPADESKYQDNQIYQVPVHENGLAKDLGQAADMFTPAVALSAAKPIAKGVEYGARELAGPVGRGMQKVAVMQAKSAIPINIPFARKGAQSETFLKEGLLSGGKNKAYEKSSELSKDLGNQVVSIIEQGKNEGKTIDGLALIDNLKSKFKSGPIETKEGIRTLEPASQKFLAKAEKLIKRMSQDGDGVLSVKQGHAVKQWAQKQADYPGQALAQGLTLTAEADAAGLTAADLGHEFRTAIESKVPEVKDLNARLAKVIPAKQAAGWKQAVRDRQELVPLKALVAVTADIAASKGAALGLLAMNTAWKSGRISQTMYNLGSKLIKAGNVAEKTKIETAMEKAVSKGMISNDEIEALKSQLEIGKRPFLPSITEPNELAPRSRSGRPVLGEQPPTYVPRQGSTESPFGKPQPPAPIDPELAGWEALDPRNRQALPPEKEIIKREFKGRTKPEDHAAMEDLLSNGGHGVETITIKAEDAPKTFTLGGVEFTKGRTLYKKTVFKGIRDRKFMVSSDGLIHMDKPLDEVPF
jgi:hypothetical protein